MVERYSGSKEARRKLTNPCLIATDVDKTILAQIDDKEDERLRFVRNVAPQLIRSARLGVNVAFLTGNSMKELSNRILKWLIEQLCNAQELYLLEKFHFFCNSGGVYVNFSSSDSKLSQVMNKGETERINAKDVLTIITKVDSTGELIIRPRFVDSSYLNRTSISENDIKEVISVMESVSEEYFSELTKKKDKFSETYDLDKVSTGNKLTRPYVEKRFVYHGSDRTPNSHSVQITLKPVLSFRHGKTEQKRDKLFKTESDLRKKYINKLCTSLEKKGLGIYVPRPGGRTSIDVTIEKLDKAYALRYLIDHLNVQGSSGKGQLFGSNTIYLGDEVIVGGGNDYVVSRIPGLFVLAVNEDKHLVPFSANIYVPHTLFQGPEASTDFLTDFNKKADELLKQHDSVANNSAKKGYTVFGNSVTEYKKDLFINRIKAKLTSLGTVSSDELQIMHALVSLMSRNDTHERQWISILVNELNDIMAKLAVNRKAIPTALGDSYDESQ